MSIIKGCPSTSMDDYQLNMINIIRHTARTFPESEIVYRSSAERCRYTYKEAYQRIKRLANALHGLGVNPGDKVGGLDWNSHRHFELYYAVSGTGAVFLQMNLRISPLDLTHVVNHSEAKVIFVDESLLPVAEAIAPALKTAKHYVIMTDKKSSDLQTKLSPVSSYEDLLEDVDSEYDWPMIDERSACSACYTSGTTGKPKGVYYSHRDMYIHTLVKAFYMGYTSHDCLLQMAPMFHVNGWGDFHCATFAGSKLVLPGRYTMEDIGWMADLMIEEKVTVTGGAPTILMPMIDYIEKKGEKPDFRRLRIISGATEPPLIMMKKWKELTGAEIIHGYGATETSPLVTVNLIKPSLMDRLSDEERWELKKKQGLILSGLDAKIVGHDGKELPHDGQSVGELLIRGPWITGAYYNDPRTEESFAGGFWRSGDAATIDPQGYMKIVDRYKDLIKSGGEWISSVNLENEIMAHPAVLEAAVVGFPHPKWEERPLAFVHLREEFKDKVSKDEIVDFIRPKFAKWQLPDDVIFVDDIPKTSVGKFDKKEIRKQFGDPFNIEK